MRKRYKGKYKIKNPNKYLGNPTNIIYRSLMERRFMEWCDSNDKCYKWSSEEVVIPYISPIDNKQHRYFPDFLIQTPKGWFLIEVKPLTQSRPPKKLVVENLELKKKRRYIKSVQTWLVNEAKWKCNQSLREEGLEFSDTHRKTVSPR